MKHLFKIIATSLLITTPLICMEPVAAQNLKNKLSIAFGSANKNKVRAALNAAIAANEVKIVFSAVNITPLHLAAMYQIEPAITVLAEKGADINARDDRGDTPLYYALFMHSSDPTSTTKTIKTLLLAGADVNIKRNDGMSIFDLIDIRKQQVAYDTDALKSYEKLEELLREKKYQ